MRPPGLQSSFSSTGRGSGLRCGGAAIDSCERPEFLPVECEQTPPSSAGPEESRRILETFADRGGNCFDTANEVYSAGLS